MTNEQAQASDVREPVGFRTRFTLTGLFVLVACAAAVLALFVPLVQHAREAARRMSCTNNMKQLALTVHNFESAYRRVPNSFDTATQLNWVVTVIPFVEASSLYQRISQAPGPYHSIGKNDPHGLTGIPTYLCPSSAVTRMELAPPSDVSLLDLIPINTGAAPFTHHYYGISGAIGPLSDGSGTFKIASELTFEDTPVAGNGMFQWNRQVHFDDVADGLGSTWLIGELSWESPKYGTRYRSWLHGGTDGSYAAGCRNIVRPINAHRRGAVIKPFNNMPMGSQHYGGANFAIADGTVQFVSESIDMQVYQAMADIAGP